MAPAVAVFVPVSVPPWEAGLGACLVVLAVGGVAALVIRHRDRVMRHPHGPMR